MHDLDLKSLRLMVAVCDHKTIKQAAEQEHIEPSAISKRLSQLEATLGTRLLVRGRKGMRPTEAGQALLEHARSLLFTVERMQADVASFNRGIRGQVRLVGSASAIAESLLDDLAVFMRDEANRNIQVDIEERFSKDVVRLVSEGGASLGVCWDSIDFQGLDSRPYRDDELVLAVHASHALAGLASVRFEQTLDCEYVGLPPATAVYSMLHRAAARAGRMLSVRVVVSNFDAALRVVEVDLGVSVIPRQIAARFERGQRLRLVRLDEPWARRRFAVCFRTASALPPAASRLVDFLVQRAQPEAGASLRSAYRRPA
jgi:DNA-binding transcriptional LysR family regulator